MVTRSAEANISGKYCRICWNTANWMHPTGEATRSETGSYVADEGFGHEEWLLDTAWPLHGYAGSTESYCYGFLQPIGKYRNTYVGRRFDICLYTVDPDHNRLAIGIIKSVYVPDDNELAWAVREYRRNGRLEKMNEDLRRIGLADYEFGGNNPRGGVVSGPSSVANVRFRADDVQIFDPRRTFPASHLVNRINRYHPLNWDRIAPIAAEPPSFRPDALEDPLRSEAMRHRAAVAGMQYSPEHVRLQNEMHKWLVAQHGRKQVEYEKNFVDLTLRIGNEITFFEIKTALTAKACVREALGQLLEYGHYADQRRASRLIVVGTPIPTSDDKAYLDHLRKLYRLPLSYRRWNWESKALDGGI